MMCGDSENRQRIEIGDVDVVIFLSPYHEIL